MIRVPDFTWILQVRIGRALGLFMAGLGLGGLVEYRGTEYSHSEKRANMEKNPAHAFWR